MKTSKVYTAVQAVLVAVLIFTSAIAVPLLVRPFYYVQASMYGFGENYGLSKEALHQAYNEMMDYCIGRTDAFSAGVFHFSEAGADHFADVRVLFVGVLWALAGSVILLIAMKAWAHASDVRAYRPMGRGANFWAAIGLIAIVILVGVLVAIDFDRAFTIFHSIFFPGKTNWLFDYRYDPVILILPQEFFRNCAIAIGVVMLGLCGGLVAHDLRRK